MAKRESIGKSLADAAARFAEYQEHERSGRLRTICVGYGDGRVELGPSVSIAEYGELQYALGRRSERHDIQRKQAEGRKKVDRAKEARIFVLARDGEPAKCIAADASVRLSQRAVETVIARLRAEKWLPPASRGRRASNRND